MKLGTRSTGSKASSFRKAFGIALMAWWLVYRPFDASDPSAVPRIMAGPWDDVMDCERYQDRLPESVHRATECAFLP